jgi:uncharacterized protein (DUF2344 family)
MKKYGLFLFLLVFSRISPEDFKNDMSNWEKEDEHLKQIIAIDKKLPKMNRIMNSALYNFNENASDRRNMEMSKSQEFWSHNKQFENDIDSLLKRLKYID